jgi:fructose-bisphosphate aldolase, class I
MVITQINRPTLQDLEMGPGKRTRLQRLLYKYGPANGTLLLLPIDQGLEHGPRDFFVNPPAKDPEFQLRVAKEGGFSGIVFHIGLAEKYMQRYAGDVPLILKLNGKTEITPDKAAFSPCIATVEDAVRLGADAVGYTLYVGSPSQNEDFEQFRKVREDADRYGLPVIVWAYPRGEFIDVKGGRNSLYAVDYAARVANELGADLVKLNMPRIDPEKDLTAPRPYNTLHVTREDAVRMVIESAGRALVIFAGGEMENDEELIAKARMAMDAGATGLIFGRNVWQRPHEQALAMSHRIREMLLDYGA